MSLPVSLPHGFPPGNCHMTRLDRDFFILKAQLDSIHQEVCAGNKGVHADTANHVLLLIESLNHIHSMLANTK